MLCSRTPIYVCDSAPNCPCLQGPTSGQSKGWSNLQDMKTYQQQPLVAMHVSASTMHAAIRSTSEAASDSEHESQGSVAGFRTARHSVNSATTNTADGALMVKSEAPTASFSAWKTGQAAGDRGALEAGFRRSRAPGGDLMQPQKRFDPCVHSPRTPCCDVALPLSKSVESRLAKQRMAVRITRCIDTARACTKTNWAESLGMCTSSPAVICVRSCNAH